VLNAIGNKSIKEGVALSFTISGSDADGDTLTYSASNLPSGATFDPATQTFSWTPGHSQAGVYAGVCFQVSDGQMPDSEDITITVRNVIPTLAMASITAVLLLVVAGLLALWALRRRAKNRHKTVN